MKKNKKKTKTTTTEKPHSLCPTLALYVIQNLFFLDEQLKKISEIVPL